MKRIIKLIIWILFITFLVVYNKYSNFKDFVLSENKNITVQDGETPRSILINEFGFNKYFVIYSGIDKKIELQKGSFSFNSGANLEDIVKIFNDGAKNNSKSLTILPGWNIFDIDDYLTTKGLIKSGEFILEAKNVSNYKSQYKFLNNALTLEGFLYPDTYNLNLENFEAKKLIKMQLDTFESKVYIKILSQFGAKDLMMYLNLSSILEKEETNKNNQQTVAGILLKRYRENWMIGADATACYAYNYTQEQCKMNLSSKVHENNEYNTRSMVGLPKTPICNPSYDTIYSMINYKNTKYYYYLHKNLQIFYGETLQEHINNQ